MIIREATPEDWPAIWPFFHQIVAAGTTYTYDRGMTSQSARELWLKQPPGRTAVAVADDGTILGTAATAPNQPGQGSHIANASFMVDPARSGQGVGRALCEHVIAEARAEGYLAIQFNAVAASNTHAVALYRSLGFEILATVPDGFHHPEQGYVGLHIMYLKL